MPKTFGSKETLRHIKYKAHLGGKLPVAGVIDLVVVGNGGQGCPRSVMVTTSMDRYLFNCGEGTQRLATEHRLKITRLSNIFITHKSWDNIGGLPGMALTLQSTNVPQLTLHGPPDVEKVITQATSFSMLTSLKAVKEDSNIFEDNTMKVVAVPINKNTGSTDDDFSQNDIANAFICTPQQVPGKLDIGKAVDLGVPRGPFLGMLKDGQEVTLNDGRVIKPEQVLCDVEPVRPFVVVECPSANHIDSLVTNEEFAKLHREGVCDVIVHMTSSHVMSDERYRAWMERFGPQTKHLIVNGSNEGVSHRALYRIQAKLNQLHSAIFPLLPTQINMNKLEYFNEENASNIIKGYSNLRYRIRPSKDPDRSQCVVLDNEGFIEECREAEGFLESLQQLREKLNHSSLGASKTKPEVLFLGTGSSVPSKERNVSGILLNISEDSSMVMDCGEGTCAQIQRFYGEHFEDVLCRISAVFVSHMHADHHLGLFSILETRKKALLKKGLDVTKLAVIGPFHMKYWLDNVDKYLLPVWPNIEFISIQHVVSGNEDRKNNLQEVLNRLHLSQMLPVEVRHCKHAYGLVVQHPDGWKIVYSGDTMPCETLVTAGKDCDLLIHEATMEDDMEEDAALKTHSTTSQAIDIGKRMNAGFILLNHFSQRYAKIPIVNENFCDKVGISFDNMRVSLGELQVLPHLFPTLKLMFHEHYLEMEEKIVKRTVKRKLDEEANAEAK